MKINHVVKKSAVAISLCAVAVAAYAVTVTPKSLVISGDVNLGRVLAQNVVLDGANVTFDVADVAHQLTANQVNINKGSVLTVTGITKPGDYTWVSADKVNGRFDSVVLVPTRNANIRYQDGQVIVHVVD